eukprot:8021482-Heterocapsa_arctica.AAC.1
MEATEGGPDDLRPLEQRRERRRHVGLRRRPVPRGSPRSARRAEEVDRRRDADCMGRSSPGGVGMDPLPGEGVALSPRALR